MSQSANFTAVCNRKCVVRIASVRRDAVEPFIRVEARMTRHRGDADTEAGAFFRAFRAVDARQLGKPTAKRDDSAASWPLGKLRSKAKAAKRCVLCGRSLRIPPTSRDLGVMNTIWRWMQSRANASLPSIAW